MWRTVHHYSHAIEIRAELLSEIRRCRRENIPLPPRIEKLAWRNPGTYDEFVRMLRFIDPRSPVLLLDAGGNTGDWAELFLRFFPNTSISAFEPVSHVAAEYRSRFGKNHNVALHEVALSAENGTSVINVAAQSARSSMHEYASSQDSFNIEFTGQQAVTMKRLDDYQIAQPEGSQVVLKIDVQGHETQVIQGAERTLENVDLVFVECCFVPEYKGVPASFSQLASALADHDLQPAIFRDYGRSLSPYAWERDVIFVKSPLLEQLWGW